MTLLLHSLTTFRELIVESLEIVGARHVVEIGSETGGMTELLLDWAREHDGTLTCVEPEPSDLVRELARATPALELVDRPSPAGLAEVPTADVYVIDGDHNFWTVREELRSAHSDVPEGEPGPLCVLHDVAWPCARRDYYYAPDRLPPEAVHPHRFDRGVVPGEPGLVAGGFRSRGEFAQAEREGGEGNGVLTAVEAFRAERPGLRFVSIPAVFGVGFLFSAGAPYGERLAERLAPYDASPLLQRLEDNRVKLYVRLLELQDELNRTRRGHDRHLAALEGELAELRGRVARAELATVPSDGPDRG